MIEEAIATLYHCRQLLDMSNADDIRRAHILNCIMSVLKAIELFKF